MFMSDNKKKATQIIAGFGAPEEKPLEDGAERLPEQLPAGGMGAHG